MGTSFLIASNIFIPTITGLFFFIYFLYFILINNSSAISLAYFTVFLLTFSLFLIGRPLQLVFGPYPSPLIIVNIRVFIFCSVCFPSIMAASRFSSCEDKQNSNPLTFATGLILGTVYVVFNTAGTSGSALAFEIGSLQAFDNYTPMMTPPLYGREVTIAVQVLTGLLMFSISAKRIIMRIRTDGKRVINIHNKNVLFNSGILLFAMFFIIGSITRQWWLYYFTSVFSAFLFGAGVITDIREIHTNYERLVPFIKEDIMQNLTYSGPARPKLGEMLDCLGKDKQLDTFALIMTGSLPDDENTEIGLFDVKNRLSDILQKEMLTRTGFRNFIIIPLDNQRLGIAIKQQGNISLHDRNILELFEEIQKVTEDSAKIGISVGIGRSYRNVEDLRTSYHEALHALEYAARQGDGAIIHVNNIQDEKESITLYPAKEKAALLSAIKLGDIEDCMKALDIFLEKFRVFADNRPEILKIRLYELIGACIDKAVESGGNEEELNRYAVAFLNDAHTIDSFDSVCQWLKPAVARIVRCIKKVHKKRSSLVIENALNYIAKNYSSQISYKDVARELFISSSYFLSLFKQETGTTFVDYLTTLRIEKSKEMLVNSTKTITEIATENGINNPNYFSSIFRKTTGVSAKDYRNAHKAPV